MTREELIIICEKARSAAFCLTDASLRFKILESMADMLENNTNDIVLANELDIQRARENGISESMIDRLMLNDTRIKAVADAVRAVNVLPDPLRCDEVIERPNGLIIKKQRVPMGVIGMIYEARPNVTVDAAALALKSGNAIILRGGKEALSTNFAIVKVIKSALLACGVSEDAVYLFTDTSHESAEKLMKLRGHLDLLIPRGGKRLINTVVENSSVPVIETGAGNCHIYIEKTADPEMAINVLYNAKTSRVSVCNAAESLLIDEEIAPALLPRIKASLDEKSVELRGCPKTLAILNHIKAATNEDFYTEYNDYILSIKVVSDYKEAVQHINTHNTKHSEAIISTDEAAIDYFMEHTDAAALYVNASTRFTDGGEFGLGAEIGISTQKLHARGPFALEALTTTQYRVYGNGQVR